MHDDDAISNPTTAPDLDSLIDRRRRALIQAGLASTLMAPLPASVAAAHGAGRASRPPISFAPISFAPIGIGTDDSVRVPAGYRAEVLYA